MGGAKLEKKPDGHVAVIVNLSPEMVEGERDAVEKRLFKSLDGDGFRAGKMPAEVARNRLGELRIWEEMVREVLAKEYINILRDNNLRPLGAPSVTIKSIAPEQETEAQIDILTMPEITLPDYKGIAREKNSKKEEVVVNKEDIDGTLLHMRRMRAQINWAQENPDSDELKELHEFEDDELPELADDWIASFTRYKTVAEFTDGLHENIKKEKEIHATQKLSQEILDEVLAQTKFAVAPELVQLEIGKMWEKLDHDLEHAGIDRAAYLADIKKTQEELAKEWEPHAEKNAKLQVVFIAIAETEKLVPEPDAVKNEVEQIVAHYREHHEQELSADIVRPQVEILMQNKSVVEFLAQQ